MFRAFVDEWLRGKMQGWVIEGIQGADLVSRMSAVTSMSVLRNNAPAWLTAASARVKERDTAGTNIISRGFERLYGAPARSPAVLSRAHAWAAERQSTAAAIAAAATAAQQAAAAAAGTALVEAAVAAVLAQGGGVAAIAAAALAAQATAASIAPATAVAPENADVSDASMELVGVVAALEASAHALEVPKMPRPRVHKGALRPGVGRRVAAANRAAEAVLRLDDDEEDEDEGEEEEEGKAAAAKPKRRRAPAKGKPKGPTAKRGGAAAAAAASAASSEEDDEEEHCSSGSDDGRSSSNSSDDGSEASLAMRSNRSRPVGKAAAGAASVPAAAAAAAVGTGTAAGRTREEHKIPRLWQAVQELATAGKLEQKGAAAWQKVQAMIAAVLLVCEAGDDAARADAWKGELARMEVAYKAGGAAITSCEVR